MSRFKDHEEIEKAKYEFPKYTNQELHQLNNLFDEKYNGGKIVKDVDLWFIDEGALNKNGNVIIKDWDYKSNKVGELYPVCEYPTKYLLLQDKLEKATKLRGQKEYAIKKELEEIENGMEIINETEVLEV